MSKNDPIIEGTVLETLPNLEFRIELDDGRNVRAYTCGKMKLHKIRVLIGDRVEVVMPPGSSVGRVVRRMKL